MPAPLHPRKSPGVGPTGNVRGSPHEQEVGIGSSSGEGAGKGPSTCARTSPYTSPSSGAREGEKTKKAQLKKAREDKRAEKEHKKRKSTASAEKEHKKRKSTGSAEKEHTKRKSTGSAEPGTSSVRKMPNDPEEGRRAESTTFELPLYTAQSLECGYGQFVKKALSLGLHSERSRLSQAAILAAHSSHAIFRAALDEAEMLANKKKYEVLVKAHELRAKEIEEKAAKMDELQAELMDKTNRYESVQAAFEEQASELELETALKRGAMEQCEDAKRRLADVVAKAEAEREENQANIVALIKELEVSRARAAKLESEVEAAKRQGAEEFQTSPAFKDLELKWKQEAYYAGVDTNFQILTYYKALDLPKFLAASADPVAQASAPKETYATQWGHLLPPSEDEVNEEANS